MLVETEALVKDDSDTGIDVERDLLVEKSEID